MTGVSPLSSLYAGRAHLQVCVSAQLQPWPLALLLLKDTHHQGSCPHAPASASSHGFSLAPFISKHTLVLLGFVL